METISAPKKERWNPVTIFAYTHILLCFAECDTHSSANHCIVFQHTVWIHNLTVHFQSHLLQSRQSRSITHNNKSLQSVRLMQVIQIMLEKSLGGFSTASYINKTLVEHFI